MPKLTYRERLALVWEAMREKERELRELQEEANAEVIFAIVREHKQRPVPLQDVLDKEHSG